MDRLHQLSRLGLFDSRVPRYTSYPTAPQFTPAVGAEQQDAWLRTIPAGAEISVYVHVPFCRRLCWFCACRTQGTGNMDTVRAYLGTLKREIETAKAALPTGVRLSRLHWGGGTPTLLDPEMIGELAAALFDLAPLADGGEFSVEIDPNEIDASRLDALMSAGMTRASIGVQDFDGEVQATIGRVQSFDVTRAAADALRARGIGSLNADIVYGLPHQSNLRISDTVQRLLSLNPDRVALYGYAHVPWMARRQAMIPDDALPSAEERLGLFETAAELFLWDGYEAIGIDHFARPTDGLARAVRARSLRRNFQGYTDDTAEILLGLGASAISQFPGGFVQNASSTGDYVKRIRETGRAGARGHVFGGDDRLRARIIEALMCDFRVETSEVVEQFGLTPAAFAALCRPVLGTFAGYVDLTPEAFTIRPEGRPLTRMIARSFDAYALAKTGHSSAV